MCNIGNLKTKTVKEKAKRQVCVGHKKVKQVTYVQVPIWKEKLVEVKKKQLLEPEQVSISDARTGWRFMTLDNSTGLMSPLVKAHNPWTQAIAKSDRVPEMGNRFGLYIFRTKEAALKQDHISTHKILCRVKYWGTVIQHHKGVRSEFAEIEEIIHDSGTDIEKIKTRHPFLVKNGVKFTQKS